ncbi:MAG TPA: Stp1/IreP family PP2C-type Ser/Thr phosphatase [Thermoanaerobaculia bacterium]
MSEQATATSVVSSNPLVVRAVLRTDVGRVRSGNQDFGSVTTPAEEGGHSGERLLIVADGMGGHRGGATASRIAGETVKSQYDGSGTEDIAAALRDALTRANSRIFNEAQTNADLRGMGTTTSVLLVRGNQAWLAHVGDSRIYLVRGDTITQLTDDHSLVAVMVREGLLTSKEAENHPRRNVLQRSIGVSEEVDVDVRGPIDLQELDTFVLCSDGLHGLVKPNEIKDIVLKANSIEEAADTMVRIALERGGPDNVTVIVARLERADAERTVVERGAAFDETIREEATPVAGRTAPVAQEPEPIIESVSARTIDDQRPTTRLRASAVVKWALLFVFVLGAAGAWLFLNQQQMFQSQSSSSRAK